MPSKWPNQRSIIPWNNMTKCLILLEETTQLHCAWKLSQTCLTKGNKRTHGHTQTPMKWRYLPIILMEIMEILKNTLDTLE